MQMEALNKADEKKAVKNRKQEMKECLKNFEDMPDRLLKYCEILIKGKDASPYSYQDTMSFRGICIALTAKCNMHCKWCFRFDPSYRDVLDIELPFEKYEAIINNTEGRFRMVHLAGLGEPTMYPRLPEAISLAKKLSDNVRITTNASLLNRDYIDKLVESGLTQIEVSITEFDEEREKKTRGVDLRHSLQNVLYMSNHTNLDVQINTCVSTSNYEAQFSMVDYLKEAKKLRIHTIPLFETKQSIKKNIRRVPVEKYKTLLEKIESDIDKYNLDWEIDPTSKGSVMDPIIEMKIQKNICFTCFEDPYINEKGELISCVRLKPFSGVDATVGFEKVWNHQQLVEFRKKMLEGNYPELCAQLCYLEEKKNS